MNKPRIVHCKKESYDVYIGRPSKWGNPYSHLPANRRTAPFGAANREAAIEAYRIWINLPENIQLREDAIKELRGKTLGCWCAPKPCHGAVLLEIANNENLFS